MAADPMLVSGWDRVLFGAVGGAVGVLLGFGLTEFKNWLVRKRKHGSYWRAIRAEVDFARHRAQTLIDDKIAAPLYRLPDLFFKNCYPELLSDGSLTEAETVALMSFFTEVEALNRGLDMSAEADNDEERNALHRRNVQKANALVSDGVLYKAAFAAIARHIS